MHKTILSPIRFIFVNHPRASLPNFKAGFKNPYLYPIRESLKGNFLRASACGRDLEMQPLLHVRVTLCSTRWE